MKTICSNSNENGGTVFYSDVANAVNIPHWCALHRLAVLPDTKGIYTVLTDRGLPKQAILFAITGKNNVSLLYYII